jgi:hypothetical protein
MAQLGKKAGADFQKLSAAEKSRRAEKSASAKLRGRKGFNDQSNVDKLYKWLEEQGIPTSWSGDPVVNYNEDRAYYERLDKIQKKLDREKRIKDNK